MREYSLKKTHLKMLTMIPQPCLFRPGSVNTLRPRQDGCHFPDNIFKWILLNGNVLISLTFVPRGPINNIPALFQIMAWCHPGNKPLPKKKNIKKKKKQKKQAITVCETMMVSLLTHICVTWPQ